MLTAGVASVALVLMAWGAIDASSSVAEAASRDRLQREAEVGAEQVSRWVADMAQYLAGWTQPYDVASLAPALQEGVLRSVYVSMPPSTAVVALVDADGVAVVPSAYLRTGVDPAREAVTEERAAELIRRLPLTSSRLVRGAAAVGSAYTPPGARRASVPMLVVASDDQERPLFLGAEIALVIVDELNRQSGPNRVVALLDEDASPLTSRGHPLLRSELLRSLVGIAARVRYRLENGEEVEGFISPVDGTGWSLLVAEPSATVVASSAAIQQRVGRLLAVVLLGAVLVAVLAARSIAGPVSQLSGAVEAFSGGRFDVRTLVTRHDEIGDLARVFNRMAERLDAHQRELVDKQSQIEGFNADLQRRVEQRTAELKAAQAELVRSSQLAAVAELGAGLAHELNNPLASVLGLAQVLRSEARDPALQASLDDLVEEARRCRGVVEQMQRLALPANDQSVAPSVDLGELVRDAVRGVADSYAQRGLQLSYVEPASVVIARVDPMQGSRVLIEVLHAMRVGLGAGSSVTVRVSTEMASHRPGLSGSGARGQATDRARPDRTACVSIVPSGPSASAAGHDDWMAAGMRLWVARRLLATLGGALDEPTPGSPSWRVRLVGG